MQFVYPAFLFALASLAIPVIVHLFNFRRYQKVQFSNVQFLKQLQEQQTSRRNLKERLILLSRLLTLLFLVLAFAQPFIPQSNGGTTGKMQAVSIFVDNSYSMQNIGPEGSLFDQAKQKAKDIAAAYGVNDRFQLLTHDFEGKHQRLLTRDEFKDAVDAVQVSSQSRDIGQVLIRQTGLLTQQHGVGKAVYMVSDFQQNMRARAVDIDKNIPVRMVQLTAQNLPNVAVDSVWLLSAVHQPGAAEKLVVKLHNYAAQEALNIPLKLFINGQHKALGSFTIAAGATITDTLSFSGLQAGWQRGEIQVQDNPVTFDNTFYFSFNVKAQLPVLLIDGGAENVFLNAVFSSDRFFKTTRMHEGNLNYAALNTYPLIVLSDIENISQGLARQLIDYVRAGGTLAVFPAADANVASYQALLQPLGASSPQKIITEDVKVGVLNQQNTLFKDVFDSFPQNPDMPLVKKYYSLRSASGDEPIMQLVGRRTFWSGYSAGKGRVYVSAVALNDDFSNLQRHGLFVPVMFRIALLSGRDMPLFYTMGNNESIETTSLTGTEKQVVSLNKDELSIIPDIRQQDGVTRLYMPDQLKQKGLYELKKQDSTVAVLAFNDNRSESDMRYLSRQDIGKILPKVDFNILPNKQPLANMLNATNNGIQLWKLCILLALISLAAEIVLIRYYKTDRRIANQA